MSSTAVSTMNDRETYTILKLLLLVLQLAVVVILVLTGIQFKNTKEARDFIEPLRNHPDAWKWSTLFNDLDYRYCVLLGSIVSLAIEVPVILASLFLKNYVLMYVAGAFHVVPGAFYMYHAMNFGTRIWLGGAIAGFSITFFSGYVAITLASKCGKIDGLESCQCIICFF